MEITYTKVGDYYIPDIELQLPESGAKPLGKYARMRRSYLMEYELGTLADMVLSETLFPHLWEVDEVAKKRIDHMMRQLLKKHPAPDKKTNQMGWVSHMNALKKQAEEVVIAELIYV